MYDNEEEKMSERSYVGDVELGSVVGSVQSNSNPHITSSMPNQVVPEDSPPNTKSSRRFKAFVAIGALLFLAAILGTATSITSRSKGNVSEANSSIAGINEQAEQQQEVDDTPPTSGDTLDDLSALDIVGEVSAAPTQMPTTDVLLSSTPGPTASPIEDTENLADTSSDTSSTPTTTTPTDASPDEDENEDEESLLEQTDANEDGIITFDEVLDNDGCWDSFTAVACCVTTWFC